MTEPNIDDLKKSYKSLMLVHWKKSCLQPTKRCAQVLILPDDGGGVSLQEPFQLMREDDVRENMDESSDLVVSLLTRMRTYNPDKEVIVAIRFGRRHILFDVLRIG